MDYSAPKKSEKPKKNDDERPVLQKAVVGEVITKKRPLGARFKDTFFGGDVVTVTQYLAAEVMLPALRNLVVDAASKGVERLIYGDSNPRTGSRPGYSPSTSYGRATSYTNYSRRSGSMPVHQTSFRGARDNSFSVDDVVLPTKRDAQSVLERMQDVVDSYDVVTVRDLKELLGIKPNHIDNNWGWVYLNDVDIRQVREGYLLRFPSPDQI